ncbi:MAG: hypothetical protein AB7G25_00090 [Sphingomonadaceae bacterium]
MDADFGDNFAERKMVVIAGYTLLMLNAIGDTCHTGAREDERQPDAQHREKPKTRGSRHSNHDHGA